MSAEGRVLAQAEAGTGMAGLAPEAFEPALLALVGGWLGAGPLRAVACGMVGARQGWVEAPYATVPAAPLDAARMVRAPVADARLQVAVIPGLRQDRPADVMRGEETQIAGFLATDPQFDGVLCLPGTHTKWARISAGEVAGFQTFMTGEMFGLLAERSVLRHTVGGDGWDGAAFDAAVAEAVARPERLAARLFSLRAEALLDGLDAPAARARLSGALIGTELAAAKAWWLGTRVAVIGAPKISAHYARALGAMGAAPTEHGGESATLAGLIAAHAAALESIA